MNGTCSLSIAVVLAASAIIVRPAFAEGPAKVKCAGQRYAPVFNDPLYDYAKLFIDSDEWREQPVRHRYVHGGFRDSDLRFSAYYPPADQYQGRFFHYILPVSGNEHAVEHPEYPDPSYSVGFAVDSGGYLVESNLGKLDFLPADDPDITMFKASAASAEAARIIANDMYCPHRPYGYAWGGSGGAFKTMAGIESTDGVWDGVAPFIHATQVSLPDNFSVQAHALRVLRDKIPGIIDAVEPGGSGDMYAGLDERQRSALLEVTKMGFPPRAWFNYEKISFGYTGVLGTLFDVVILVDASYFNYDFWFTPGYLGFDHPEWIAPERIVGFATTVRKVLTAQECRAQGIPLSLSASQPENADIPAALVLADLPKLDIQGGSLSLVTGAAAGSTVYAAGLFGDAISISYGTGFQGLVNIAPGDVVTIDNSVYLASQTYHRHEIPATRDYYTYDQFRNQNGDPIYPQRLLGVSSVFNQAGKQTGKFNAKMISVVNLMDEIAFPWGGDWYRSRVKAAQPDKFDDVYRLWYVDHAMHTPPSAAEQDKLRPALATHTINYGPVLQQALRDLAAWAEQGIAPPASTAYEVVDGQVEVPATAEARNGVQPVATATANGAERADVAVGDEVTFQVIADVPPGTGSIVAVEWDFEGAGDFPVALPLADTASSHAQLEAKYRFSKPGTYFPAARVSSHRAGNANTPYARIPNLARVRVVVK